MQDGAAVYSVVIPLMFRKRCLKTDECISSCGLQGLYEGGLKK
jgi:hypothetical protein